MKRALRKVLFAFPFGCLVAIAAHAVHFGDDHVFGGEGNEALVATALGGSIAIALAILHTFLTAGTTTPTGTLAAARARQLIPSTGMLFVLAASVYYGIETLEGHGLEFGQPTLLLAALAAGLALALRAVAGLFAGVVAGLVRDWLARLERREHLVWRRPQHAQPMHAQIIFATRRLGRAPPNGQRLSR